MFVAGINIKPQRPFPVCTTVPIITRASKKRETKLTLARSIHQNIRIEFQESTVHTLDHTHKSNLF
jgi:hypothetical protein